MTAATATTLVTVLRAAGRAGVAVCLWGDPDIGKSALIQAAAAADDVPCETVIGSLREPSDFAGLPVVTDDGVRLEPPSWAKRLHAAQAGYLFLVELSTSPPTVHAAMLGVALERRVGDLLLPRAVQVVAAANPPDRAADGWDLSPPLANRFLHISDTPDVDGWLDGMTAGFSLPAAGRVAQPSRERSAIARASVAAFLLEYDRGTERAREYAAKLEAYYRYRDSGAAARDYLGFPTVLVVTTSERAEEVIAHQAQLRPSAAAARRYPCC